MTTTQKLKPLFNHLHLFTDNESYTFFPAEPPNAPTLTVYRTSGDIVVNPPGTPPPKGAVRYGRAIHGIVGMIALTLSEYLIVITDQERFGGISTNDVWHAKEFEIMALNPNVSVQNTSHPVEAYLLALVKSHLNGGSFFFSHTWDLSRRLQVQWRSEETDAGKAMWEVADDRFFWNKFLQSRFIDVATANPDQDLSGYIMPMIYGTFEVRRQIVKNVHVLLYLISRRSRYRAGTRYFRRGVDEDGNVANFNETEQMVLVDKGDSEEQKFPHLLSYVQTRGSIPVYWAEITTLRYKPDLQIMEGEERLAATKKHLADLVNTYGEQTLVNLVNHKGHEQPVKEAFEKYYSQLETPKVQYEYFDFHTECRRMRWDRISVLIDKIKDDIELQGYFSLNSETEDFKLQSGSVRTNCMDNLDRTNVAQAAIAKYVLTRQLQDIGVFGENETVDDHEELSAAFRELWSEHADAISRAYSGTGALKTDFTRTGKRTKKGALDDFYKSAMRYLKNNFFDGARQDAFDLVTGVWTPEHGAAGFLISDDRPLIIRAVPYISWFSVFMVAAGLTLPRSSNYSLSVYFLLWFTIFGISLVFILAHGIDYVSWPRLISLSSIINYNGPGYRGGNHGKGINIPALDMTQLKAKTKAKMLARTYRRGVSSANEIEMGTKKRVD